jgi:hypothetical protein
MHLSSQSQEPLGKLGVLPPEIRALIWCLVVPAERTPALLSSLALSRHNCLNINSLSALMRLSGTHHDIGALCSRKLLARQFNISFGVSALRFEGFHSSFIGPASEINGVLHSTIDYPDTAPNHAIEVFAQTAPRINNLQLTIDFDLTHQMFNFGEENKWTLFRWMVLDVLSQSVPGSIKGFDTRLRINMGDFNAEIGNPQGEFAHTIDKHCKYISALGENGNIASDTGRLAANIMQPFIDIIDSMGFGQGQRLILATESFDRSGCNRPGWGTWKQLEDTYHTTVTNLRGRVRL